MNIGALLGIGVFGLVMLAAMLASNLIMIKVITGKRFTKRYMSMVTKEAYKAAKKVEKKAEQDRLEEEKRKEIEAKKTVIK